MAKQDVLDAINSTIVQNDIKAITAQSLNNSHYDGGERWRKWKR